MASTVAVSLTAIAAAAVSATLARPVALTRAPVAALAAASAAAVPAAFARPVALAGARAAALAVVSAAAVTEAPLLPGHRTLAGAFAGTVVLLRPDALALLALARPLAVALPHAVLHRHPVERPADL
jgi:hypothetical protein